jgi:hypothetical protein
MEMRFRFDIMKGENTKKQINEKFNKLIESLSRHQDKIEAVYKFCETIAEGPLWTFCGGGMQLQQFYGDDDGYICILYLDMEDEKENEEDENEKEFTLAIQNKKLKKKFKDFNYNGIKASYILY